MARKKNTKKSFSSNLDNLFGKRLFEDNEQDNPVMFDGEEEKGQKQKGNVAAKTKSEKSKPKSSRKSFSNNLEQFFKESLDGIMDGVVTDVKQSNTQKDGKRAVGLDLLIKRTTSADTQQPVKSRKPHTKRVTLVLDNEKLEELKRIAKKQKKPLRQIVEDLVEEYLDNK